MIWWIIRSIFLVIKEKYIQVSKVKIVILDGYTLNPGDLNWDELRRLGDCEIHDRTPADQIIDRARDAEILLTNKTPLNRESIFALDKLKYIGVMATGYNIVDIQAAAERNIVVTNVPTYGTRSVAQMTLALILELTQHVGLHSQAVRRGEWVRSLDWSFWQKPLIELEGLTAGIIGLGRIGRATANLLHAFGMEIIAFDPSIVDENPDNIVIHELESVLKNSDFLCLHCPLTADTDQFINKKRLQQMKKESYLINTSRGQLINEQDLADALNAELIAGAALDVLSTEPPHPDNPLLGAKNCIITPHIAWATKAARKRLMGIVVKNVKSFINGACVNRVYLNK